MWGPVTVVCGQSPQGIPQALITQIRMKVTYLKSHSNFPSTNELTNVCNSHPNGCVPIWSPRDWCTEIWPAAIRRIATLQAISFCKCMGKGIYLHISATSLVKILVVFESRLKNMYYTHICIWSQIYVQLLKLTYTLVCSFVGKFSSNRLLLFLITFWFPQHNTTQAHTNVFE